MFALLKSMSGILGLENSMGITEGLKECLNPDIFPNPAGMENLLP